MSPRILESNSYNFKEKSSTLDDANSAAAINDVDELPDVKETELESESESKKSNILRESVLWNKLEGWVEQYKQDIEFWGIGRGPVFTVFKNGEGKIEKVVVNEDEILSRIGLDPLSYKEEEADFLVSTEVNSKISHAKTLARQIENGNHQLPGNSSVVKFVTSDGESSITSLVQGNKPGNVLSSGIRNFIQEATSRPDVVPKLSRAGILVLFGIFVISAVKHMFAVGEHRQEYTSLEKEMLRRKIKARRDKERNMESSIEVIDGYTEPQNVHIKIPQLDKHELLNDIAMARETLASPEFSGNHALSLDFEHKIQEIREMARDARKLEKGDTLAEISDDKGDQPLKQLLKEKEMIQKISSMDRNSRKEVSNGSAEQTEDPNGTKLLIPSALDSKDGLHVDLTSPQNGWTGIGKVTGDAEYHKGDVVDKTSVLQSFDAVGVTKQSSTTNNNICKPSGISATKRFRIIQSAEEAREYLSKKHDKGEATIKCEVRAIEEADAVLNKPKDEAVLNKPKDESVAETGVRFDSTYKMLDSFTPTGTEDFIHATEEVSPVKAEYCQPTNGNPKTKSQGKEQKVDIGVSREAESSLSLFPENLGTNSEMNQQQNGNCKSSPLLVPLEASNLSSPSSISCEDFALKKKQSFPPKETAQEINETVGIGLKVLVTDSDKKNCSNVEDLALPENQQNWIEKNFHEVEPIVKKIGAGYRDNYMVAKEKTNQDTSLKIDMKKLIPNQDGSEFDWMKDERLKDIVFKVRDNELAGRDPFHLMHDEEKLAFFTGLEKKVEQENAKLLNLHEWVHSNIENLDYGEDGISVYDPLEKIIPRWKGPPIEEISAFLRSSVGQEKSIAENNRSSDLMKHKDSEFLEQSKESLSSGGCEQNTRLHKSSRSSRTVIEGSDGSTKAGKKSGKEFWQHTKKWSQGFLDSYNAETDPEIKDVMKDIGKDLDRWITEKEIKEAGDLMDKLPERGQKFIREKLDKVKREMEMFGPHAVVSKYREYADEKEEDYLWWLDLPYILCIELYTEEDGKQEVGFYSLEMAPDLDLDPKQYHVIAFEDAGDCKNLCHIIQSHMEMLEKGHALVVARQPKDAFREAKANGFGVTVIRKREVQLNVDQTLEEVEELITEVGSKIYHDKIMRERSLDVSAVMKGAFGLKKPTRRRRSMRKLKKPPTKSS